MPTRPRTHQLETKSRLAFAGRLPESWVFRAEDPDYGIDGSLEVFSEMGEATGLRCLVQLKAKAKTPKRTSVRIRRDTFEYYKRLDLPVLIVLYIEEVSRLYARWTHEFDPYYGGLGEKWVTFPFDSSSLWSDETATRLEKDLRAFRVLRSAKALPLPLPVTVQVSGKSVGGIGAARLAAAIERRLASLGALFMKHEDGVLWVDLDDASTVVSFRGKHAATLHTRGMPISLGDHVENVLLLCSLAAGGAGDYTLAATLSEHAVRAPLANAPDVFGRIVQYLTAAGRTNRALELSDELVGQDQGRPILDGLMAGAMLGFQDTPGLEVTLESHLRKRLAHELEAADGNGIGVAHYNLASFFRGQGRYREAIRHFRAACEYHNGYQDRDYIYREIAACLFGAGFYTQASAMYAIALEKGGTNDWRALYADALLFAGRFSESVTSFTAYLDQADEPRSEWIVKAWAAERLATAFDDSRDSRAAFEALDDLEDHSATKEDAHRILDLDPLSVPGWLMLAGACDPVSEETTRVEAVMLAAFIAGNDPLLWAQAFVHAGALPDLERGVFHIAFAALETVGAEFAESVHEYLSEAGLPGSMEEVLADGLRQIEDLFASHRTQHTVEVRLSGEGSDYQSLTLPAPGEQPKSGVVED